MNTKEIELSSIETCSYWWINIIQNKVRELANYGCYDKKEAKFLEIFYKFNLKDYRNLYLELINYITEDVNNYIPTGTIELDAFNQDTDYKGHNRLNEELSKILKVKIPDIRLASKNTKDSVIYTNIFGTCVWYKSIGVRNLPTKYKANYILTGNKQEIDFYYLLMSTIYLLGKDFNSGLLLKEYFCNYYQTKNKDVTKKEIEDLFIRTWQTLSDKDIIIGGYYKEFFQSFKNIDIEEIRSYTDLDIEISHEYAEAIKNTYKTNILKLRLN